MTYRNSRVKASHPHDYIAQSRMDFHHACPEIMRLRQKWTELADEEC